MSPEELRDRIRDLSQIHWRHTLRVLPDVVVNGAKSADTFHAASTDRPELGRYLARMSERKPSPEVSNAVYENFLDVLWKMESAVGRNVIQWSTETAETARRCLENLASALGHIAIRLRDGHGGNQSG